MPTVLPSCRLGCGAPGFAGAGTGTHCLKMSPKQTLIPVYLSHSCRNMPAKIFQRQLIAELVYIDFGSMCGSWRVRERTRSKPVVFGLPLAVEAA